MLKLFRKNTVFCDAEKKTLEMPVDYNFAPKAIYFTLCDTVLSVGDSVSIGEKIGSDFEENPVFSGVSGKIAETNKISETEYRVKIENDFANKISDSVAAFGKENSIKITDLTPEILIDVIGKNAVKTRGKQISFADRNICQRINDSFGKANRIIVNCVGGEPYDTSASRLFSENMEDLLNGLKIVMAAMKIGEGIILRGSKNTDDGNILSKMLKPSDNIKIAHADPAYPSDNEHSVIYAVTSVELSRSKNAEKLRYLVFDVREIVSVARAFVYGERETGEVITLSGDGFECPKNVYIPYGAKISEIADYVGINKSESVKILAGGVLRGREVACEDIFECGMSPIVALKTKNLPIFKGTRCTRCGECMRECPMLLMPMYISNAGKVGKKKIGKRFGADLCIECGICQYVCPSGIPVLENIRKIKNICENKGTNGGGDK